MMNPRDEIGKAYKKLWETSDADSLHALRTSVLTTVGGSYAYGIENESSDVDIRGIFIPSMECIFGLKSCNTVGIKRHDSDEIDLFRPIQDFVKLASKCSPTVIEQLFVNEEHMLYVDPMGERLLESKHLFLSKKAKYSFSGYAMKEMSKRRDLKDYCHVLRLLYQGREILTTGTLKTFMEDPIERQHILNIKNGVYSFDEIQSLYNSIIECYEEYALASDLPDEPDFNAVNSLLVEIMKEAYGIYP